MNIKEFIKTGDTLFVSGGYGDDDLQNDAYDDLVKDWENLKEYLRLSESGSSASEVKKNE